jgi:hypothetical protein
MMMAYELQAPNHLPDAITKLNPVMIFTAGSIEMGKAEP